MSYFEPEGKDAATTKEVWNRLTCAGFLMMLAVIVPIISHYGFWKLPDETIPAWVIRSGALVTMLALLAEHVLSEGVPRLTNPLISRFQSAFSIMRKIAFLEMVIGTAIWGYADRIFY
ncbi:hypothetical protein [Pseudomonas savastanoi]|uniref:hypothetical protein n=1 Tax=Pseudomonas savastanoi TaxID=29438 RepID=UPI0017851F9B|nr:hypothetical protein [Pseudomonas savastanoi]QOI04630.1 hypothetical protein D5S10_12550 [Pseudomonas savastanoi]